MSRRLCAALACAALIAAQAPGSGVPQTVAYPDPDLGELSLSDRSAAQRARLGELRMQVDFRFTDRLPESGISFVHGIAEESKKTLVPMHYDHGSSVVAADVDGDGLTDLFFVSLMGANHLYRNSGSGTFEDITLAAGVGLADRVSMAASFADVDNDGDPDLFVTTVRGGNVLFENDGGGHFRDIAHEAGLDHVGHSSTGTFFDYDADGLLDLYLTNVGVFTNDVQRADGAYEGLVDAFSGHLRPARTERSILYRNLGGMRFQDVSDDVGLVENGWVGDSSLTDFDRDGDPDLYLTNMQGDDRYWENREGTFVEATEANFSATPWGTMGIKFFDFDNDGDLDLMLTDMHSDMSVEVGPEREREKSIIRFSEDMLQGSANNVFGNAFYRNDGDAGFKEISDEIGAETYWPWGVSVGDMNADGWLDAFVSGGMGYPYRYSPNSLLLNAAGARFADAAFPLSIEPRRDGRIRKPWFLLDCQPGADIDHGLCRRRSGLLEVQGTLSTRGSVLFDLDGDHDLDIVTNEFGAEPQILTSDLAQLRSVSSLKVTLRGTQSNRDGLGAWVTVTAGGQSQTRYHDGKSGYMAQSSLPLYFGLGDATQIEIVEVVWPSGVVQTLTDLAPGLMEIVEPTGR